MDKNPLPPIWPILQPICFLVGIGVLGWLLFTTLSGALPTPVALIFGGLLFALFLSLSCQILDDVWSYIVAVGSRLIRNTNKRPPIANGNNLVR